MLRVETRIKKQESRRPSKKLVLLAILLPVLSLLTGAAVAALQYGVL